MDSGGFEVDEAARSLRFQNGRLTVEWGWDEQGAVGCRRLRDGMTGAEWIDEVLPSPLYSIGFASLAANGSVDE
ncbi:MAG: hypothetical protein M3121_05305, partial [Chloroflexota bacterium]|nr:hypothetical protein [Chloroflexota bacterium]